jgi:hypothetical protein
LLVLSAAGSDGESPSAISPMARRVTLERL